MNLFSWIFFRRDRWERKSEWQRAVILNHEYIHTAQMEDFARWLSFCKPLQHLVGGIIFYIIYFLEWVYRLIFHTPTAYRGISFEREAYAHQSDLEYLKTRKHFAEWKK